MINTNDAVAKAVYKQLQEQMNTDDKFKKELSMLYFFYERKLLLISESEKGNVKEDAQQLIFKELENVIFSQYFQGYYVMKHLLLDDETNIDEEGWSLNIGQIRNEVPTFLESAFINENIDWSFTEVGHSFGIEVLDKLNNAFDTVKQLRKDVANYGAFKAFTEDERYIGKNNLVEDLPLFLGNPFDLEFISPQVYMQAQFFTGDHELWDLFFWSSVHEEAFIGSVHLSKMNIESSIYTLELKLDNVINYEERLEITNSILQRLPNEVKELVQTRLYHFNEVDILVASSQ